MLANESIQYMARMKICEDEAVPNIEEMRDLLDRLIMGMAGNFKIASTLLNVLELKLSLDSLINLGLQNHAIGPHFPTISNVTHYTIDSRNSRVILD